MSVLGKNLNLFERWDPKGALFFRGLGLQDHDLGTVREVGLVIVNLRALALIHAVGVLLLYRERLDLG